MRCAIALLPPPNHGKAGRLASCVDGDLDGTALGSHGENHEFGRYVRGLCSICTDGSFDQTLDLLLRAYSVARNNHMISRHELASIVAKHVVYDGQEVETRTLSYAAHTLNRTVLGGMVLLQTSSWPFANPTV